jgi:hypothetical protein
MILHTPAGRTADPAQFRFHPVGRRSDLDAVPAACDGRRSVNRVATNVVSIVASRRRSSSVTTQPPRAGRTDLISLHLTEPLPEAGRLPCRRRRCDPSPPVVTRTAPVLPVGPEFGGLVHAVVEDDEPVAEVARHVSEFVQLTDEIATTPASQRCSPRPGSPRRNSSRPRRDRPRRADRPSRP